MFNGPNLSLSSDVDQDTYTLIWCRSMPNLLVEPKILDGNRHVYGAVLSTFSCISILLMHDEISTPTVCLVA